MQKNNIYVTGIDHIKQILTQLKNEVIKEMKKTLNTNGNKKKGKKDMKRLKDILKQFYNMMLVGMKLMIFVDISRK